MTKDILSVPSIDHSGSDGLKLCGFDVDDHSAGKTESHHVLFDESQSLPLLPSVRAPSTDDWLNGIMRMTETVTSDVIPSEDFTEEEWAGLDVLASRHNNYSSTEHEMESPLIIVPGTSDASLFGGAFGDNKEIVSDESTKTWSDVQMTRGISCLSALAPTWHNSEDLLLTAFDLPTLPAPIMLPSTSSLSFAASVPVLEEAVKIPEPSPTVVAIDIPLSPPASTTPTAKARGKRKRGRPALVAKVMDITIPVKDAAYFAHRSLAIRRYKEKRSKRVWTKRRMEYGERKKVADKRIRVGGRFVSKSKAAQIASARC